ncbi:LOW QUALITY PROTEIN: hypothetical protein PanWU01x14_001470 [Parasponia andersonii]|uniref:Uncharacterized protein n=1 Tax=Parasponia andersonii TaxID=3476 RepID=A0A2P5E4Y0_PARAD|nr:LOW QUALITY PROTEIN: hypothetical protein PanWU01x14_001470 [Parasponia andersonii]
MARQTSLCMHKIYTNTNEEKRKQVSKETSLCPNSQVLLTIPIKEDKIPIRGSHLHFHIPRPSYYLNSTLLLSLKKEGNKLRNSPPFLTMFFKITFFVTNRRLYTFLQSQSNLQTFPKQSIRNNTPQ